MHRFAAHISFRVQGLLILFVMFVVTLPLHAQAAVEVDIRIDSPDAQSAIIEMQLSNLPDGTDAITMFMGREFAYTRTVDPAVLRIVADSEQDENLAIARSSVNIWRIETGGAPSMRIRYEVGLTQRDHPDVVANRDQYEWPYIAADHGMLYTAGMLMLPRELDLDLKQLTVRIHPPDGWNVIAPWPLDDTGAFHPPDLGSFLNDYIAIGAWQQHVIAMGDFTATVAIAPGQEQIVRAAIQPIRRIVEYELQLFEWDEPGKFLFCFGRPDEDGTAGSPKSNSMTLMVAPNEDPQRALESISHLIAHEFFHLWASAQIERMPDDLRFFNEGFTEYYAWLVSARLGLISWEQFAEAIGEAMLHCERLKPARMSLVQAGGPMFFQDQNAAKLVYQGGMLMAALLDVKIRMQGHGDTLDKIMRAFINSDKWKEANSDGHRPTPDFRVDFIAAIGAVVDDRAWVSRYLDEITGTWSLKPKPMFAELGIAVEQIEVPRIIDFGGTLESNELVMVIEGLGASQLGLREGDIILECNERLIETPDDLSTAWIVNSNGDIAIRYQRERDVYNVTAQLPRATKFVVPVDVWRD